MKRIHLCQLAVGLMVFAFLLALEPGVGAQSPIGSPVRPQVLNNDPNQSPDPSMTKLEKEAEKQRNLKRQQDIRRDSEKLLQLATELKQYVDKTNENIISLDVIRKAEQIEKLAKNVKEKMKQ